MSAQKHSLGSALLHGSSSSIQDCEQTQITKHMSKSTAERLTCQGRNLCHSLCCQTPSHLLLATVFPVKGDKEGRSPDTEAATDCKAARVICIAAPPHSIAQLVLSSSSLTETHKHHNFCQDNFRELQKASLGTLGRTGCKHCCAGWPVRSCGLCLEEMDEKMQAGSWMKTELSRMHLWICRIKAIDCKEKSWSGLLKYSM